MYTDLTDLINIAEKEAKKYADAIYPYLRDSEELKRKCIADYKSGCLDAMKYGKFIIVKIPKQFVFESCNKPEFLEKYKDIANTEVLTAIWDFGNSQWEKGYNKGFYNPGFEN